MFDPKAVDRLSGILWSCGRLRGKRSRNAIQEQSREIEAEPRNKTYGPKEDTMSVHDAMGRDVCQPPERRLMGRYARVQNAFEAKAGFL